MEWSPMPRDEHRISYAVLENGTEVARALVNVRPAPIGPNYQCPSPRDVDVQLEKIEVRIELTRNGQHMGRRTVEALRAAHPGRMYAFAAHDAPGFYRKLGWAEYEHVDGPSRGRSELFVAEN
ncbi:hypothetical protein [Microbacterium sp. Gd 4-13]|uniref:hypothetical protein n=1 Tax=Microbacterium sp. Gd 4-13 TaxID=2173179 RepID=UPI001057C949|nr:hypothetical protein [Microbacterium sp. Gd 4-13]